MDMHNIITAVAASIIFAGISAICKWLVEIYKNRSWRESEINRILFSLLSENEGQENILDIIKSKFYIPIRVIKPVGDKGPHDDNADNTEELETIHFIDYLTNNVFGKKSKPGKKRFFVLGGSGMGKSTFSAAFVYFYIKKHSRKSIPFDIELVSLGQNLDFDNITLNNPQRTILILDGLDENLDAIKDKKNFIEKIDKKFNDVGGIILTCRTQFLEDRNEELISIRVPTITKYLNYKVFYISPFTKEDVRNYLGNKYQIPSDNYSRALRIVDRSADLMSRPLILSFIDDILDLADSNRLTAFLIYKKIIDSWFDRECRTFGIYEEVEKKEIISKLYFYSKKISVFIYKEWENTGDLSISKEKFKEFIASIGCNDDIPFSFRERSLLNRKSDGSIKFAHKSILEFFLAIDAVENPGEPYSPIGFEMASTFFREIYQLQLSGLTFTCINYYNSDNIEYNDEYLKSILDNTYNSIKNTKNEKESFFYTGLYEYCYKYIRSVKSFTTFQKSFTSFNTDKSPSMSSCHISLLLQSHIAWIHDLFDGENETEEHYLRALDGLRIQLTTLNVFGQTKNAIRMPIPKNYTITPNLIRGDENFLSSNYVEINSSFTRDDIIANDISKILQINPKIGFITIIKNGENTSNVLNFISFLHSKYESSQIGTNNILVYGKIGSSYYQYVINSNVLSKACPQRIIEKIIKYQQYQANKF